MILPYDSPMVNPPTTNDVEAAERGRIDAHELSWALRELTRLSSEVDVELAQRLRLRPTDYAAVGHVMMGSGSLGPLELSHRLGISSGSTTELVDRLERAGHVERHRDSGDRRRVSLTVTDSAAAQVLFELRPLFDALDAVGAAFSAEEQDVIGRYLRTASQALRTYAAGSP